MELHFESANLLVARFSCPGEPELRKGGGLGWFPKSKYIDWRCGWRLSCQCSIMAPKEGYGLSRPAAGTQEYEFADALNLSWNAGGLSVNNRVLTACLPIPDCLDRPPWKFSWSQPILLGERVFHCSLLLKLHDPKDGSYPIRNTAHRDSAGGIEFLSSDDEMLTQCFDSEARAGPARPSKQSGTPRVCAEQGSVVRASSLKGPTGKGRYERIRQCCLTVG